MIREAAVSAPAKVNLFLRVGGRRPDGFHDIETLFQAVSLADRVVVRLSEGAPSATPGSGWDESGRVSLEVDGPDLGPASENLAVRAAVRFLEESEVGDTFVHIRLLKRIPAGAGLGGGSSDGAAVLRLLSSLTGRLKGPEQRAIAAELGSDVAFFLESSPLALGSGRGERLRPLSALPEGYLVLALPPDHVATADAYRDLSRRREGGPRDVRAPTGSSWQHPSTEDLSWADVTAWATNDFEPVVAPRYPRVRESLEGLREHGAALAMLSGSGSAVLGVFQGREESEEAALALSRTLGWPFQAVRSLRNMPEVRVLSPRG